jgi:DNA-binding transcriptional ArsR family regulator
MSARAVHATVGAAPIFAALGDVTRLQLVSRLSREGPQSITRLAGGFAVSRQAITKHLRVLEQAGVIRHTTGGRETLWHVERGPLTTARRELDAIADRWEVTLRRLKAFVEEPPGGSAR